MQHVFRSSAQALRRSAVGQRTMSTSVHLPLQQLTDEEQMFKDMVSRFANEEVAPKVRSMDESMTMCPDLIKSMFDNGLMGVETEASMGGSEASFMSAILVIEELAKIDPSVSVCCDVQNTLVNNMFKFYGTKEIQDKYLPRLATDTLGSFGLSEPGSGSDAFALATKAEDKGDHYVINGR